MKYLIPLLILSGQAHAFVVDLRSDQTTYSLQSKAVLLASVTHAPVNAGLELYFEARMNGESVKAIRVSDNSALTISPVLATAGGQEWAVEVYWQNKIQAKELAKAILVYGAEIDRITALLATETNPTVIATLQAEKAKNESRKTAAEAALEKGRKLIEAKTLSFDVNNTVKARNVAPLSGILSLSVDRMSYVVGDVAKLTTEINVGFEGKEPVLTVDIDGTPLSTKVVSSNYLTESPVFTVAGTHTFHARYDLRPTTQANLLRDAVSGAYKGLSDLTAELRSTTDAGERLYIQKQIDDLAFAISGVNAQLTAILDHVVTESISFEVMP